MMSDDSGSHEEFGSSSGPAAAAADEQRQFGYRSEEASLTLDPKSKIVGLGVLLLIPALALVVEIRAQETLRLNQTHSEYNSTTNTTNLFRNICPDCIGVNVVRCLFYLVAIVSILLLEFTVLNSRPVMMGSIGEMRIPNPLVSINAPHEFCILPSPLLVLTFLVFSIPNWLSMVVEIICGAMEIGAKDCLHRDLTDHGTVTIVRRSFALGFSLLQTRFFLKYFQKSIQLRLGGSWVLLAVVMAVNTAVWFTTVGLELQDISGADRVIPECTFCANSTISPFNDLLYPFKIEYCVLSSLMAVMLMSNLGRLAIRLRENNNQSEKIISLMQGKVPPSESRHDNKVPSLSEIDAIKRHSVTFLFGATFVLAALFVIGFVRFDENEKPNPIIKTTLFSTLFGMHVISFVACGLLMCYIDFSSIRKMNKKHLVDRLLLLLGVIAILVNNIYSSCENISSIACNSSNTVTPCPNVNVSKTETALELAKNIWGIFQSILQSCVLELLLICELSCKNRLHRSFIRFKSFICRNGRRGEDDQAIAVSQQRIKSTFPIAILNFLILVNGAEWLLSALCFSYFFSKEEDKSEWVSPLLMPLQVFYWFHTAVCIFDIKSDLGKEGRGDNQCHDPGDDEMAQALLEEE